MDRYEVLVHIAAPSGNRDDKRYQAQAEAIARFEPATVTKIYSTSGVDDMVQNNLDTPNTNASFTTSLAGWSDIIKETPLPPRRSRHLLSTIGGLPVSSGPQTALPASWTVSKQVNKQINASKRQSREFSNLPYKNPLLKQSTIQAVRTPEPPRPRTAPAGDTARANTSLTGWSNRKRARSESSSFEGLSSIVKETPHFQKHLAQVNSSGSSTQYVPSTASSTIHTEMPVRLSQESNSEDIPLKRQNDPGSSSEQGGPPKRQRLTDEGDDLDQTSTKEDLEQTSTSERGLSSSLPLPIAKPKSQPFFLRNREPDWTSSASAFSSDSSGSTWTPTATATPSQLLPRPTQQHLSPHSPTNPTSSRPPESPIDLVSPSQSSPPPRQLPTVSSPPAPHSSPRATDDAPKSPISALSKHAFPRPPPTGDGPFVTHITPQLEIVLKEKLSIAKHFRPVYVSRDVGVLERGHWRIPITIASAEVVAEARKKETELEKMERRRKGLTPEEGMVKRAYIREEMGRRNALGLSSSLIEDDENGEWIERQKQDMWTEKEFVEFWKYLEDALRCGFAGWGVRAYREELTERDEPQQSPPSSPPLPGSEEPAVPKERRVLIKITTWAEVIPHVWIWLWVMSDKILAHIPMEWRAGDNSVVVRMSGYRRRHGVLGDWVYKGPPGEKGIWGIVQRGDHEQA